MNMTEPTTLRRKPGPRGVQYDEVAAVADALVREGLDPTTDRVMARLAHGSTGKVCAHMRQWTAARQASASSDVLDIKIDDAVLRAVRTEIHRKVEEVTADCTRRAEEAEKDREAIIHESAGLSQQPEQSQSQIEALVGELAQGEGALTELRDRLDKTEHHERVLRNEIERLALEAAADRSGVAQTAMAERLIADLNTRLTDSDHRRVESEARCAEAMAQNANIQELLTTLTTQLNGLVTAPSQSRAANAQLAKETAVAHPVPGKNEMKNDGNGTTPKGVNIPSRGHKPISKTAAIIDATTDLLRARGPLPIREIRNALVGGNATLVRGKTINNLSATLSKAKGLAFNRDAGSWQLR
jgi:myosin heavy subunit